MIYIDNNIKLYLGDSIEIIKTIPDNSVDLIITDPPYLLNMSGGKKGTSQLAKNLLSLEKQLTDVNLVNGYDMSILDDLVRVMKKINIYIWCNGRQIPTYIKYFMDKLNCKLEIIIWGKTNPMPLHNNKYLGDKEYCLYFRKNGYCQPSNYEDAKTIYLSTINVKDKQIYGHPTIKPLPLIRKLIRNSSKENDLVLDCFLGSGTTAVACILENRNYIGFEINKKYFDIANKRINETTKELMLNENKTNTK